MRKLTLLLITLLPLVVMAQDAIILKDGSTFNCKVISETKQEVVFKKDSITKRVPSYLVQLIRYNATVIENIAVDTIVRKEKEPHTEANAVSDILPSDSITNNNLYMAGQHKLNALNLRMANIAIGSIGGTIAVIAMSPMIAYGTSVVVSTLLTIAIVEEYKSALSLRKAGTVNTK